MLPAAIITSEESRLKENSISRFKNTRAFAMKEPIVMAGQVLYPVNMIKASASPAGGQSGAAFEIGNDNQRPTCAEI